MKKGIILFLLVLFLLPFAPKNMRVLDSLLYAQPVPPEGLEIEKYEVDGYTYEKVDKYTAKLTHPVAAPVQENVDLAVVNDNISAIENAIASCDKVIAEKTEQKAALEARLAAVQGIKTVLVDTVKIVDVPAEVVNE